VSHFVPQDHALLLLSEDDVLNILDEAASVIKLDSILFILVLPKVSGSVVFLLI
jgi:hypothetical protein